ncbi:hypothetical protein SAMN05444062_101833 [Pseudomonas syringae]|jgi:hypothetical protein|nr:hypothetical protein [Pseudomonas sp. PvP009]SFG87880.1 hypothetical protein SAMN05444062_101833 [Pseudomonas syringae]
MIGLCVYKLSPGKLSEKVAVPEDQLVLFFISFLR